MGIKKDKYSGASYTKDLKTLQESKKRIVFFAAILGSLLCAVPIAVAAGHSFTYTETGGGKSVNAVNNAPNTLFIGDSSNDSATNPPMQYNYVGTGGNDTFGLFAGQNNCTFVATGSILLNNTFYVLSGNGTSTFSLISGSYSKFFIGQNDNGTGLLTFAITGGNNSLVSETNNMTAFVNGVTGVNSTLAPYLFGLFGVNYEGPTYLPYNAPYMLNATRVGQTTYSINLGTNGTVDLGSVFSGNDTTVNVVF